MSVYRYLIVGFNRKDKSAVDGSEGSEATEGDEHGSYEWVEKTHETMGISSAHQPQTNGHCWAADRKPDVTNHLTHLSHRGYGSANGKLDFLVLHRVICRIQIADCSD
jgi:hypothetical protein